MKGQMWVKHQWSPLLQRFRDQSLMKAFSNIDGITIGKLDKANHHRMYIKCITISDLAHTRGVHIPGNRMNGEWHAPSTLIWPQLPWPPPKYWQVFRWCIRQAFSSICQPGHLNSLTGKSVLARSWFSPADRALKTHCFHSTYIEIVRKISRRPTSTILPT